MRILGRNAQPMTLQRYIGMTPELDQNGFKTGNKIKTYSEETEIKLNIYPSNNEIEHKVFGNEYNFDMVATSIDIILGVDDILKSATHNSTYRVAEVSKSLNSYTYGLEKSVING